MNILLHSMKQICLAMAIISATAVASAAPFSVTVHPKGFVKKANEDSTWNISLQGEIDASAPEKVKSVLKQAGTNGADVYLDSPGGNIAAAMVIGRLLRSYGARTIVGRFDVDKSKMVFGEPEPVYHPGNCYSSCTLAFLGGVYRSMVTGSKYGVHRFYSTTGASADDLDIAQMISATIASYIREMDVDPALFDKWMQEGKNSIRILTKAELEELSVVNNGRQRPSWVIEAVQGGQILTGSQQTMFGLGRAIFICGDNGVMLYSFNSMSQERATEIQGGTWYHSLLLDGKPYPVPKPVTEGYRNGMYSSLFKLTHSQVLSTGNSGSIGHSMQLGRDAPTFIGYSIDVPVSARSNVKTFLANCLASSKK